MKNTSKKMGFLISLKNGEERRALLPSAIAAIKNKKQLVFETGYGSVFGIEDAEYIKAGANIASREDVLKCEILVDVKLGDADWVESVAKGKLLVGWAHATQAVDFASAALNGDHTVLAWEEIFEGGRYIFYRNREIAGEAAIIHGFRYSKKMPYDTSVAILGNGHTAKGALRVLHGMGTKVLDIYPRKLEKLFVKKMYDYDVLVNCVMWDTSRTDRLIYKEDLKKFKKGTLIIDVSCDPNLEIETTVPTSIDNPVYEIDGVVHYCVDNTPAMYGHTVTNILSEGFKHYIDQIIEGNFSPAIKNAIVIEDGYIVFDCIKEFRQKKGLFVKMK